MVEIKKCKQQYAGDTTRKVFLNGNHIFNTYKESSLYAIDINCRTFNTLKELKIYVADNCTQWSA